MYVDDKREWLSKCYKQKQHAVIAANSTSQISLWTLLGSFMLWVIGCTIGFIILATECLQSYRDDAGIFRDSLIAWVWARLGF